MAVTDARAAAASWGMPDRAGARLHPSRAGCRM